MKKAELKKILHAMIDSLTDKRILYDLEKDVFPYVIKYRTKKMDEADDDLTEEQIIQLDETFSQADAGETITLKEVKKSFAGWLPDDDKQKKKEEKKILEISKKKLRNKLHSLIDEIDNKYVLNVLLDDIMPDALNTSKYD
jgi:ABC-type phosphate transport system auxiliary subunit